MPPSTYNSHQSCRHFHKKFVVARVFIKLHSGELQQTLYNNNYYATLFQRNGVWFGMGLVEGLAVTDTAVF